jgi:hypothetical protein
LTIGGVAGKTSVTVLALPLTSGVESIDWAGLAEITSNLEADITSKASSIGVGASFASFVTGSALCLSIAVGIVDALGAVEAVG